MAAIGASPASALPCGTPAPPNIPCNQRPERVEHQPTAHPVHIINPTPTTAQHTTCHDMIHNLEKENLLVRLEFQKQISEAKADFQAAIFAQKAQVIDLQARFDVLHGHTLAPPPPFPCHGQPEQQRGNPNLGNPPKNTLTVHVIADENHTQREQQTAAPSIPQNHPHTNSIHPTWTPHPEWRSQNWRQRRPNSYHSNHGNHSNYSTGNHSNYSTGNRRQTGHANVPYHRPSEVPLTNGPNQGHFHSQNHPNPTVLADRNTPAAGNTDSTVTNQTGPSNPASPSQTDRTEKSPRPHSSRSYQQTIDTLRSPDVNPE